ncbi:MAG: 7-carboxy-7-deazaguanine synthase QueE [Flavobacteriales bacterium]|nr:7-carboxy-7-deazaguanine synthase QueE [Flavobacteriales bacterium]
MLSIKETFLSIQGEGFYAGQSSYFIRTQGCDIGCHWCDEPNSWSLNKGVKMNYKTIINNIKKSKTNIVVVTGGEPLMHNLEELTSILKVEKYSTHLETSGAYPITGKWDWITLSPKKVKPPQSKIYKIANELKVVIYNKHDFKWALDQSKRVQKDCLLYIQPEWSRSEEIQPLIIDFIQNNPLWRLSLQTHKYLKIQ